MLLGLADADARNALHAHRELLAGAERARLLVPAHGPRAAQRRPNRLRHALAALGAALAARRPARPLAREEAPR
jgi:hypothetical protein